MSDDQPKAYHDPNPHIPASLSEINELLGSVVLGAPTFVNRLGDSPHAISTASSICWSRGSAAFARRSRKNATPR